MQIESSVYDVSVAYIICVLVYVFNCDLVQLNHYGIHVIVTQDDKIMSSILLLDVT